jgi:Sec-independent protein secretion pathway component TatC
MQIAAEKDAALDAQIALKKQKIKVFRVVIVATVFIYALFIMILPFGIIPMQWVIPLLVLFSIELVFLWIFLKVLNRNDEKNSGGFTGRP